MVIKLYISGISGNKEVKKKQQRVQMILDSKQINYEAIDITEPGKEKDKEFMQQNGKVRESLGKYPLPPQIFNDDDFCGDYEDFDMANEVDELEKFLHIETSSNEIDSKESKESLSLSGHFSKSSTNSIYNPYEYHTFKIRFDDVNGLKEQNVSIKEIAEEKNESEELAKREVNGECEAAPGLEPASENLTENFETSVEEVDVPKKEESAAQEAEAKEESGENENEKKESPEIEEEAAAKEEEENVEPTHEEEVENPNEEKSPPLEEEKEKEEEEEAEEKEEKEDEESPQSEKSQED